MRAFLACVSFLAVTPSLVSGDAKSIQTKLEGRFRGARTLQATFLERYRENDQLRRAEAGTAYFRRPGKMRWDYESPEKNVFVVDGKTAWFYVPTDHTVTRVPAKHSTDWRTPLALLAGDMKLSRVCARVELASAEKPRVPGNMVLHCVLRGENKNEKAENGAPGLADANQEDTVFLEVAPGTGDLARVLVRETGGIEVEFNFENWKFDPIIADSLFRFDVPAGVAIVNGEDLAESRP